MKKNRLNNILRWAIIAFICSWGLAAFIILAADVNPYKNVSPGMFVMLKIFGIASLILCCYVGKILFNAGLLPDEFENY